MKATVLRVTAIVALVMAFATVSVQAQTVFNVQKFNVPFEFSIGDKVLPAGEYIFTAANQTIRIQERDGKASAIALPQRTVNSRNSDSEVKLTFRRYGDQYYLSQVWLADGVGRELKRKRPASTDLAQNFIIVEVLNR